MTLKVTGTGKIKSHISTKEKVNATTGDKEKVVVETEIKEEIKKQK